MEFGLIAATAADWPIVGQIAWVFGKITIQSIDFSGFIKIRDIRNMYYSVYEFVLFTH